MSSIPTHFRTPCPHCQHELKVRAEYMGKNVVCKHCGNPFTARGADDPPLRPTASGVVPPMTDAVGATRSAADADTLRVASAEWDRIQAELGELGEVRARLSALRDDDAALRSQLAVAETARDCLSADLRAERATSQETSQRVGILVNDLTTARAEGDRLRDEVRDLQGQLAEQRHDATRVESLLQELAAVREGRERRDEEVLRLQAELASLHENARLLGPAVEELTALRDERARWHENSDRLRAELTAHQEEAGRLKPLAAELDTLRAERDRVESDRRQAVDAAERLREVVQELEKSRAEATARDDAAVGGLTRTWVEERVRWETERQAHAEERASAEAERVRREEQSAETRRLFVRAHEALQADLDRLREEQEQREVQLAASTGQVERLLQERDLVVAQRAETESRLHEAERAHQSEVARLAEEGGQHRQRGENLARQVAELVDQVRTLQADLDGQRRQRVAEGAEHEQGLAALRLAMESARGHDSLARRRAAVEAEVALVESALRLAEVNSRLHQVEERESRLQNEMIAAHAPVERLSQELRAERNQNRELRKCLEGLGIFMP